MPIAVVITRPDASALELADTLRTRWGCGVEIVISPVLEILPVQNTLNMTDIKTLIFTSRNGVAAFLKATERRDLPCVAVGPATAQEAQEAGLQTAHADGDAVALAEYLKTRADDAPFLHIRGTHVSSDLAEILNANNLPTTETILYNQVECSLTDAARKVLAREQPVILPLYSPRSAKILFSQMQEHSASLFVAAISETVAQNVPKGFAKSLLVAEKPNGDAMLTALDLLYDQAKRLEGANRAQ